MESGNSNPGWLIILNPHAGGNHTLTSWSILNELLIAADIPHTLHQTQYPLHAIGLVRQGIAKGFRNILAIGGDGTINECVNGIFQQELVLPSDILFTAMPVGTGSDWARMNALPVDPKIFLSMLEKGKEIRQDIGKLICRRSGKEEVRYFNNIAGLGYDAFVTEKTSHLTKSGLGGQFFYFKALLGGLFSYRPIMLDITGDDFHFSGPVYSANVAICRYNGGGMRPAPLAIPDDGLFDITLIEPLSLLQILSNLIRLYNGTIYRHPKVSHYLTRNIRINAPDGGLVEVDGEVAGTLPAEIEILPLSLRVLVP